MCTGTQLACRTVHQIYLEGSDTKPKLDTARAGLMDLARGLGAGAKLPKFLDLRKQIGISAETLDDALADLEARNVIYRRHGVGIFVADGLARKTIALMCDPKYFTAAEVSPFWHILIEQVRASVAKEDHRLLFQFTTEPVAGGEEDGIALQTEAIEAVKIGRIHGVLGVGLSEPVERWLEGRGVPVVGFAVPGEYRVGFDAPVLVSAGVRQLVREGARRIGLWLSFAFHLGARDTGEPESYMVPRFREVLDVYGLTYYPELVREARYLPPMVDGQRAETFWEQGYQTASLICAEPIGVRPDAIICNSELMVQGALIGMERCGIRIGKDVKVVGHANVGSRVLLPWAGDIIRVANDPAELARAMLLRLEMRMRGESPEPKHLQLMPKVIL